VDITLSVFGDVQLQRRLLRIGEHADDARPAWGAIEDELLDIGRKQFASKGARAHPWAALEQSTIDEKARLKTRYRSTLKRTGALWRSVSDPNASPEEREVIKQPAWMAFRVLVPYGEPHQKGSKDGEHPPQRRIIDLTSRDRTRLVKTLQRYLVTGEV
jgi:hypothetical protein